MSQSPARRARRHGGTRRRPHEHLWKHGAKPEEGWVCVGCGATAPLDDPELQR